MGPDSRQTLIVRLHAEIARAARAFVAKSDGAYAGLDELLEVALFNQLSVEGFSFGSAVEDRNRDTSGVVDGATREVHAEAAYSATPDISRLSAEPALSELPPAALASTPSVGEEMLFVLTNRMSPIKVAARALALAANEKGAWPAISEFHERACTLARHVGQQFRRDGSRRWVGYPIGKDLAKARERFINSFTITMPGGRPRGPMALLGLPGPAPASESRGGRRRPQSRAISGVGLTEAGWQFAVMPSPIFRECEGETLSAQEAAFLTKQLLVVPKERSAVREFLGLVRRAGGVQMRLDELMAARESSKSADLVVAERAALVGRLVDLQLIHHEGRGAEARINLTTVGRDLQKLLEREQRELQE